eukprot:m.422169 g.422169  ORF g.422169 m.422169 type:complete len:696 (+) comp16852_c0_seq5:2766-4853(+)
MSAGKKRRVVAGAGGGGTKTLPPASDPADPDKHVVFPMQRTAGQLEQLLKDNKIVFVRSGVGNGKTTLAHFITKDPTVHLVPVPREQDATGRMRRVISVIGDIATAIFEDAPDATADLASVLKLLGDAGHVLVFDEAHLLFSVTKLCDVLFKDPPCPVLLFSASSERTAGPHDEQTVTPAFKAKYMWYPKEPLDQDVVQMVEELNTIGIRIDESTFSLLYMISGGNRDIFFHALRWLKEQNFSKDEALARVRLGLTENPWGAVQPCTGLLPALQESRAVQANGGYEDARNVPELFVRIVAAGPQEITDEAKRRPLTIRGLILPAPATTNEFVKYNWTNHHQKYSISSALRASYYGSILKLCPFSMTCGYDPTTDVTTCAQLCARAFPLMVFTEVVQRPARAVNGELSLASAIRACGLAPEDDYNAAFQRALEAQGFDTRDYKSTADGGKIDHHVWVDTSADRPVWGLEFEHFGDKTKRKEHALRFTKEGMETYRMAKFNALVVLCSTQRQVDLVMKEALEDAAFRPDGVDVIAQLVSTSHESYTMTVLPAGAANPLPPVVLQCDGVAKTIVDMDDGSLVLESAQHLGSISGMKYQDEEAGGAAPNKKLNVTWDNKTVAVEILALDIETVVKDKIIGAFETQVEGATAALDDLQERGFTRAMLSRTLADGSTETVSFGGHLVDGDYDLNFAKARQF